MKIYKKTLAITMMVFITGIFLVSLIIPQKEFSDSENRVLQTKPSFSINKIFSGKFTSQYEKYITDQFPYRNFWVGIKSGVETILQKKDNNGVYLGKDGYLLQIPSKIDYELLNKNIDLINKFELKNSNVKVNFMLVPNSVKILEEKLPLFATHQDEKKIIDIVGNKLNKNINFIDVYDDLKKHKNEYIYYKTDHHWTTLGAYYGYRKLSSSLQYIPLDLKDFNINKVTDEFYGTLYSKGNYRFIKPDFIEIFKTNRKNSCRVEYVQENRVTNTLYCLNHLKEKDKYAVFLDGNHPLVKIKTNIKNNKKILLIKDSYAHSLVPFLTNHYNEIYMIDLRYFDKDLKEFINKNNIKEVLLLNNVLTFIEEKSFDKLIS